MGALNPLTRLSQNIVSQLQAGTQVTAATTDPQTGVTVYTVQTPADAAKEAAINAALGVQQAAAVGQATGTAAVPAEAIQIVSTTGTEIVTPESTAPAAAGNTITAFGVTVNKNYVYAAAAIVAAWLLLSNKGVSRGKR